MPAADSSEVSPTPQADKLMREIISRLDKLDAMLSEILEDQRRKDAP
jgi:hypothetical protein